jgi:hypothetical protein
MLFALAVPTSSSWLPDEGAIYTTPFLPNVSIWESFESLDDLPIRESMFRSLAQFPSWHDYNGER